MTVPTVSLVASCRLGKQLENQINDIDRVNPWIFGLKKISQKLC